MLVLECGQCWWHALAHRGEQQWATLPGPPHPEHAGDPPLPMEPGRTSLPSALIALLVCPPVVICGHCWGIHNCLSLFPAASL